MECLLKNRLKIHENLECCFWTLQILHDEYLSTKRFWLTTGYACKYLNKTPVGKDPETKRRQMGEWSGNISPSNMQNAVSVCFSSPSKCVATETNSAINTCRRRPWGNFKTPPRDKQMGGGRDARRAPIPPRENECRQSGSGRSSSVYSTFSAVTCEVCQDLLLTRRLLR